MVRQNHIFLLTAESHKVSAIKANKAKSDPHAKTIWSSKMFKFAKVARE